jgi:tetratricopeptide (TPR) repeat protein
VRYVLILAVLLAGVYSMDSGAIRNRAMTTYELLYVQVSGRADLAYWYGNERFSAFESARYDIGAAERFFRIAYATDPALPYVNHQLARIEFLHGNFDDAFVYINRELKVNPDPSPSTYYIRALIAGFSGLYDMAAQDYETYLRHDPTNWAALNDYAWVLLKSKQPDKALLATAYGLQFFPDNPWLLNSNAIALYETGHREPARDQVRRAAQNATRVQETDWLTAYPGNDPRIAIEGVAALKESIRKNLRLMGIETVSMRNYTQQGTAQAVLR